MNAFSNSLKKTGISIWNLQITRAKTLGVIALLLLMVVHCGPEPEHVVRKKLEIIAQADLAYVKGEIAADAVADSAYYEIVEFSHFPKDSKYSYKAVIDFYYFKDIQKKQVRKYRYQFLQRKWDRYFKEYRSYS